MSWLNKLTIMESRSQINWINSEERTAFENDLKNYRKTKAACSVWEKIKWFIPIFIVQFGIVVSLYGPCAYFIVTMAKDKKREEDHKCKNESTLVKDKEKCDPTTLEYYDLQNYIFINVYPFLTAICQVTAFLSACLWHVTDYRRWNVLGGVTACLCLPVDLLIFYVKPLGLFGTTAAMVLGFVPFMIIMADAAFPVRPVTVVANGKIVTINRNSWTEDLSISYNQKYNFVARMTWKGWSAFATAALCIILLKGSTTDEFALGIVIMTLQGIPQMLSLAVGVIHWDYSTEEYGHTLFKSLTDIPLVLWCLYYYCDQRTKNAVIGKLMVNCVATAINRYSQYADKYIYVESNNMELDEDYKEEKTTISYSERWRLSYDSSNLVNVCVHHILYTIACPFVGMWETFNAMKDAFIRDFK